MRLGLTLTLLMAATAAPARAAESLRRGDMHVIVRVGGTVLAEDVFRLNSAIEGRVEEVTVEPLSWIEGDKPLAYLLDKETAAMLDARATTPSLILEQRWRAIYKPAPVECAAPCFVLKVFAREKTWIQPETLLFEVARELWLTARVGSRDASLIRRGQTLTYWDVKNPSRRLRASVSRFALDKEGATAGFGGDLAAAIDSDGILAPGVQWEGEVAIPVKRDVLRVPTRALIIHGGETFLPIQVSTGITLNDVTEITSGVSIQDKFLVNGATGACVQRLVPPPQPCPEPLPVKCAPAEAPSPRTGARPDEELPKELRPPGDPEESYPEEDELPRRRRKRQKIQPLPEVDHGLDSEFPSDFHQDDE